MARRTRPALTGATDTTQSEPTVTAAPQQNTPPTQADTDAAAIKALADAAAAQADGDDDEAAVAEAPAPVAETLSARAANRRAKIAAQQAAAKAQADRDERVSVVDPEIKLVPGKQLSLHELNLMARRIDRANRDEAREAANAAGKAAFEVLSGRKDTGNAQVNRYRTMHKTQVSVAQAALAAAAKQQQ